MADIHVALKDGNSVASAIFESSTQAGVVLRGQIDPATGRILVVGTGSGSGTVTSVSVVSANGLAGTVATPTSTPAITLSTTVNAPVLAGNGTAIAAATTSGTGSTVLLQGTPTITTPVINGTSTGTGVSATPTASILAMWDANVNFSANNFIDGFTTTATAASTTTLTITSTGIQVFTGSTTQTVKLPTTGVVAGGQYLILNPSTGAVTVQSSGANPITILAAGTAGLFTAVVATPTTAANWNSHYFGALVASGKSLTTSNTLTFTGTDGSSVAFGTGGTVLYTGSTIPLTVGSTTIASGTSTRILYDNSGVLGEYTITGTGTVVAMQTSPSFTTPTLGVATATSINKMAITAPATSSTLAVADGKTFTASNTMTLAAGADSQTFTFPAATATIAGLGTTQTFTGQDKFNNFIDVNNAVTVTSNAGTVPVTFRLNTFTNSSAATMAITLATASAVDGQMTIVRIYDFSAVAQTIGWTNTENSTVTVPTTSNGSTTLTLTVGFMFNTATTKWRCLATS